MNIVESNILATDVQDSLDKKHTHANKAILDSIALQNLTSQAEKTQIANDINSATQSAINALDLAEQAIQTAEQSVLTPQQLQNIADVPNKAPIQHTHGKEDLLGVVKTVNGNAPDNDGNVNVQSTGEGVEEAPADGKTYGRKDKTWSEIEAEPFDDTDIQNELLRLDINKADRADIRDFTVQPIKEPELAPDSVSDSKIGTIPLLEQEADGVLVPINGKFLRVWLQRFRNNIKWMFENKQNRLTAGTNITIENDVISAIHIVGEADVNLNAWNFGGIAHRINPSVSNSNARNYYVNSSTGVDSVSDLEQGMTPNKPWRTLNYAVDRVIERPASTGQTVQIFLADGTYVCNHQVFCTGSNRIRINGNVNNPQNVILDFRNNVNEFCFYVLVGGLLHLEGFTVYSPINPVANVMNAIFHVVSTSHCDINNVRTVLYYNTTTVDCRVYMVNINSTCNFGGSHTVVTRHDSSPVNCLNRYLSCDMQSLISVSHPANTQIIQSSLTIRGDFIGVFTGAAVTVHNNLASLPSGVTITGRRFTCDRGAKLGFLANIPATSIAGITATGGLTW